MITINKKSDGYTLVELIVVIAVLGIIAAVAVPRLMGFRSKMYVGGNESKEDEEPGAEVPWR